MLCVRNPRLTKVFFNVCYQRGGVTMTLLEIRYKAPHIYELGTRE